MYSPIEKCMGMLYKTKDLKNKETYFFNIHF
jgi:hypothetical protein